MYYTLNDVWTENQIFTILNTLSVPWKDSNMADSLNLQYYYGHSGNKIISPLIKSQLSDENKITEEKAGQIAGIIYNICNTNWTKLYSAMNIDYSPIENVDAYITETTTGSGSRDTSGSRAETGTDNHTHSGTDTETNSGTDTHALSGTDTEKHTGTDTSALSGTDTQNNTGTVTNENVNKDGKSVTENGIAGYNSTEYSDQGKSTTTVNQTITDTRTDNLTQTLEHGQTTTETKDLTDSTEFGRTDTETLDISKSTNYNTSDNETVNLTTTDSGKETTANNITHDMHRHGNIGVTTNQQMIEAEIELRKKFFFEQVFNDLDKYLTIPIY